MDRQSRKVDDDTVQITLPKPYSPLLANLAIPIVRHHQPEGDRVGPDKRSVNPSGTGAFRLARTDDWTRDSQMVLDSQPGLLGWRTEGRPGDHQGHSRRIDPSASSRSRRDRHRLGLNPEDVEKARDNADLVVVEAAGLNTNCIEFNVTKDPFTSKEVRQALNYAVNKQELSHGLYDGDMVAAGGVCHQSTGPTTPISKAIPTIPTRRRSSSRRRATTRAIRSRSP